MSQSLYNRMEAISPISLAFVVIEMNCHECNITLILVWFWGGGYNTDTQQGDPERALS
jgi:hypothetical protein